jgi:DNA-binding response OmpR family regulator
MRIVLPSGTLAKVSEQKPISTHRALVIEDNEHIAFMLEFILERSSYDVSLVHNGRDAQTAIDNLDPVDIVILDLMLPHVSGFQLISEIRDNVRWRHVPIIVLSAKVLEEDVVKALELGASDYVRKPFRPAELLARIRRVIADREQLMRAL